MNGRGEFQVRLDVIGNNLGELLQTQRGMKAVREEANSLSQALKTGFGIDIAGRINSGLAQMPRILGNAVTRGYEFNKTMFDAEIGISNVLAKFMQLDAVAAKNEAAKAMQKIIELEPKTAGSLSDLVSGFLATVAASQAAGISVERNIELVGKFANAVANANLPTNQLAQEMRAILTGNITADAMLAKTLGITTPDVNKAKAAGTLYDLLVEKIGALGEAGDSAAVRISTLQSALDKMLGQITEPLFEQIFGGTVELTDAINDPKLVAGLAAVGEQLGQIASAGVDLTQWAIENADALTFLAQVAATLGVAFTAIKIKDLLVGVGSSARAWLASRYAIEAETVAMRNNTAAQAANAAARGKPVSAAGGFLSGGLIVLTAGAAIIKGIETSVLARLEAEDKINEAIRARHKGLNDDVLNARSNAQQAKNREEALKRILEIDQKISDLSGLSSDILSGRQRGPAFDETGAVQTVAGIEEQIRKLETERRTYLGTVRGIDKRGGDLVEANQAQDKNKELLEKQEAAYKAAAARADELAAAVAKLQLQQSLAAAEDQKKIDILNEEVAAINAVRDARIAEAQAFPEEEKRNAVITDAENEAREKSIPLLGIIAELTKKIAEENKKALEDGKQAAIEAQKQADAIKSGVNALKLAELDTKLAKIDANPFLTSSEKRQQRQGVLGAKDQQLGVEAGDLNARLTAGIADDEARLAVQARLNDVFRERALIQAEIATGSYWGEIKAEFTNYVDSLGSDAGRLVQMFTSVGESIRTSMGSAFAQAALAGGTFKEHALGFAEAVGTAFINSSAQFVADWIYKHLLMDNIRTLFNMKRVADETATQAALTTLEVTGEATRTGVKATAAASNVGIATSEAAAVGTATGIAGVFRSIMELGPIAGPLVFGASVFGMVSLVRSLAQGFAGGGIFHGQGSGTSDSNLIAISDGEGVVKRSAVDYYGADVFNAFNNMQLHSADLPLAAGVRGPASAGGGGSVAMPNLPNTTVIVIPDEREATRIARHSAARGDIVRIVREDRDQIFG